MTIWALPGFLGLETDWDVFNLKDLVGVNPMQFSLDSYESWVNDFNAFIKDKKSHFNVLMGYSLGGRLALHALIDQPHLWDAAIIISAHTGLNFDLEKKQRLIDDGKWAHLFQEYEWKELMKLWNSREVFQKDAFCFEREEKEYLREQLIKILTNLSLGNQMYLNEAIHRLSIPILWITGQEDQKFCQIAEQLQFSHPLSKWISIPNVGHRVPWGKSLEFQRIVQVFLNDLLN